MKPTSKRVISTRKPLSWSHDNVVIKFGPKKWASLVFCDDESKSNKWNMGPIQVLIEPITRARAKKFKENRNALILCILDKESPWSSKGKNKSVDQAWMTVVRALE